MLSCTVWDMDMDIGNQESSAKKGKGNLLRKKKEKRIFPKEDIMNEILKM